MLDRILLVCDEVERPFLTDSLLAHAPSLDVRVVNDTTALAALDSALLADARLVVFNANSDTVVPTAVLAALGHGAYNFHPGPPAYPGWMPAAFATYEGAKEFGATAHSISARDDGSQIVGVDTFAIEPFTDRLELARSAYLGMLRLFRRLAAALASRPVVIPSIPVAWSTRRLTRALFADLCDIPLDIDAAELHRRIVGLGGGDGISVPTVRLHGVPFRYTVPGETKR